jgi:hypothetical protein
MHDILDTSHEHTSEDTIFALVKEACVNVNAGGLISKLPLRCDTPVGERGFPFSDGQKQHIAIARDCLGLAHHAARQGGPCSTCSPTSGSSRSRAGGAAVTRATCCRPRCARSARSSRISATIPRSRARTGSRLPARRARTAYVLAAYPALAAVGFASALIARRAERVRRIRSCTTCLPGVPHRR